MSGLVTVFIGRRGSGKTTLSKKLLDKKPEEMKVMIYDINNEYQDYYKEPFEDWQIFMSKFPDLKNTYLLIEEATIFFDTSDRQEEMKNLLVRARHTQNIIQLNFHSWLSVPKNIFNMCDYVTVFKTNDTIMTVKAKYDYQDLIDVFNEARLSNDGHFHKTISIY